MVVLIAAAVLASAAPPPGPDPAVCGDGRLLTYSTFAAGYEGRGEPCSEGGTTPQEPASGAFRCINGLLVSYDRPTHRFQNTGRSCSPQAPPASAGAAPPTDDRPRGPPPM